MNLQEKIYTDLQSAIKDKQSRDKVSSLRVIVGELQRMSRKELSDEEVTKVLRKLSKFEKERILTSHSESTEYLEIIESYIPKSVSPEVIEDWIRSNIDFSAFKNKMQAMRPILNHFGATTDGNIVKTILMNKF